MNINELRRPMRGCDWLASCYGMGLLLSGRARGPEGVTVKLINSLVATGSFLFPVEKSAPDSRSSSVNLKCLRKVCVSEQKWVQEMTCDVVSVNKKVEDFSVPFCMKMTKT